MANESNESNECNESNEPDAPLGGRSILPVEPPALSNRCSLCFHSAAFHGDAGCQAVHPAGARSGPRACDCERDAMAAAHAKTRRVRHLTVVK